MKGQPFMTEKYMVRRESSHKEIDSLLMASYLHTKWYIMFNHPIDIRGSISIRSRNGFSHLDCIDPILCNILGVDSPHLRDPSVEQSSIYREGSEVIQGL